MKTITLNTTDHHQIPVYIWDSVATTHRGVIHISHGMAEYGSRYQRLAEKLNAAGFVVYAHDHRGHGATTGSTGQGYFADHRGWNKVVEDLDTVVEKITQDHPGTPLFLLGHSMGSYILQNYLMEHTSPAHGVILSGSNFAPKALLHLGRMVASMESMRQGKKGHSPLINQLTFAQYNRSFKPNRTAFDWLSRNPDEVDLYASDPLCGFLCSNHLWKDLFDGLLNISSTSALARIDPSLPVLVMGGEKDPVSAPQGQQKLAKALQKAGLKNVTITLYPDGRHEMFNETNHEQVSNRLIQWIDNYLPLSSKERARAQSETV